jgi:hypothetical protein
VIGLFLGALLISVLGTAILMFAFSGGPPRVVFGTVQGFGVRESDYGTLPLARVRVDDRNAVVRISRRTRCAVGDRIKLVRRRGLLGYRYSAGWPRACG